MSRAVILLSGGLDSAVCLALALQQGWECHCLFFDYGQRNLSSEMKSVTNLAMHYRIKKRKPVHLYTTRVSRPTAVLEGNTRILESPESMLLTHAPLERSHKGEVPKTYVPGRNSLFLATAFSFADGIQAESVFIGITDVDQGVGGSFPDCDQFYANGMEHALNAGRSDSDKHIYIECPLMQMDKWEIAQLGVQLELPHALTWSCYSEHGQPCGQCDACVVRQKAFQRIGVTEALV